MTTSNSAALLALIADLYASNTQLHEALREALKNAEKEQDERTEEA